MEHRNRHRRNAQPQNSGLDTSFLPTRLSLTVTPSATDGSIATAPAISGFTTVRTTVTRLFPASGTQDISTQITIQTSVVTDSAQYASLTAQASQSTESPTKTTSSHTTTASASSTSSSASKHASSSNTSTLIPTIVAPVAAVLIVSFVVFWLMMRRRHRRALASQPEFVMAGAGTHKGEKLPSRATSTTSSTPSTRINVEKKQPLTPVSEVDSFAKEIDTGLLPVSNFSTEDIGVARPLTPQDSSLPASPVNSDWNNRNRPRLAAQDGSYHNFSAPRPHTARRAAAPAPSSFSQPQNMPRSKSNPVNRGPPGRRPDPNLQPVRGPEAPRSRPPPTTRSGPSPNPRSMTSPRFDNGLPSNPRPSPKNTISPSPRIPQGRSLSLKQNGRASPPAPIDSTVGAFNGASPISQYSPIVKETPSVLLTKPKPAALTINHSASTSRSDSPRANVLTDENIRIARLGSSSRLGLSFGGKSPSPEPSPALSSPRLPPPRGYSPQPESQRQARERDIDEESEVSAPDDDAEYEDIDAKSDVSSLHEKERWQLDGINGSRTGSRRTAGYASSGRETFGARY